MVRQVVEVGARRDPVGRRLIIRAYRFVLPVAAVDGLTVRVAELARVDDHQRPAVPLACASTRDRAATGTAGPAA
jgi:hypothetical protein